MLPFAPEAAEALSSRVLRQQITSRLHHSLQRDTHLPLGRPEQGSWNFTPSTRAAKQTGAAVLRRSASELLAHPLFKWTLSSGLAGFKAQCACE